MVPPPNMVIKNFPKLQTMPPPLKSEGNTFAKICWFVSLKIILKRQKTDKEKTVA
jgi:hypothetical protein